MTTPPEESLKFWEAEAERQVVQAKLGLGVLAMIHNFDRGDLRLITAMLADPEPKLPARELEDQIERESGLSFALTPSQWATISIELKETS